MSHTHAIYSIYLPLGNIYNIYVDNKKQELELLKFINKWIQEEQIVKYECVQKNIHTWKEFKNLIS